MINQIAACDYTIDLHLQHQEKAKAGWNQKKQDRIGVVTYVGIFDRNAS